MAKQQRQGKGGKVEQARVGERVGVLAAIDAEKFTFLAHCDCAWDTVKCLHCSACLQGKGACRTQGEKGEGMVTGTCSGSLFAFCRAKRHRHVVPAGCACQRHINIEKEREGERERETVYTI